MHDIAAKEKMPKGLKVMTRTGVILYDSASTAGVELYDDDSDSDSNYEPSEASESNTDEESLPDIVTPGYYDDSSDDDSDDSDDDDDNSYNDGVYPPLYPESDDESDDENDEDFEFYNRIE